MFYFSIFLYIVRCVDLTERGIVFVGAAGIPVNPSWTRERPYLTRDFLLVPKAEEPVSSSLLTIYNVCFQCSSKKRV